MLPKTTYLPTIIGLLLACAYSIDAHGRLWEPPARSTMWKRGFNTPKNYNDNELFCGGFQRQLSNGYKCGVCGDPYDGARDNEAGGRYATGQIARTYRQGQTVTLQVQLTANHKGYFEFKLCPVNNKWVKATQECLDLYPLTLADGSGPRFQVSESMGSAMLSIKVVLPVALTCDQCVLQWRYHTGNSWGKDSASGQGCIGCGPQEEFYGCADVRIVPASGVARQRTSVPRTRTGTQVIVVQPQTKVTDAVTPGNNGNNPTASTGQESVSYNKNSLTTAAAKPTPTQSGNPGTDYSSATTGGTGNSKGILSTRLPYLGSCFGVTSSRFDQWCQIHCQAGYCPPSHCACVEKPELTTPKFQGCKALGAYSTLAGYNRWCRVNCERGYCPSTICVCA